MRPLTSAASLALLLGLGAMATGVPTASNAYIGISVNFAPPPLPYYEQPLIPGYGYIWTPGYWAWDEGYADYYWVPGAWVLPPRVGYLWTPGWWGWNDGVYAFNAGYWGPQIGYYGGVNYGYGYNGSGYYGGEWRGNHFYYNRVVNNVRNLDRTNIYERNFANATTYNRTSYSGGRGGIQARPTPQQLAASQGPRIGVTPMQQQHVQLARSQPAQRASFNHGAPPVAATARPGGFNGPGVVPARGAVPDRAGPAAREFRPPNEPGVGPGGQRPGGSQFNGAPRPNERPTQTFDRPNPQGPGARPQAEFPHQQQGRTPQGPNPRYDQGPPPRAEYARPAPQAVRPPPQQMRQEFHPAPQMQARPAPQMQARPAPQMQARPAPQMQPRPAAQPQPRPQPQAHPEPQARPAPGNEERPH